MADPNNPEPVIKAKFINVEEKEEEKLAKKSNLLDAFSKIKDSDLYEEAPENVKKVVDAARKQGFGGASSKGPSINSVIVRNSQRGNPILQYIRNVPWEYSDIVPDYVMGNTTCAIFLSLKYHTLKPDYIHDRLKQLGHQYELRVLLVQVDVKDPHHEIKQLTKICVLADLTLMLAWSPEEAGRIIEVYKIFEHKPPDLIMERQDVNPNSMMIDALTTIRSINRTDAMTLLSNFGSLEKIVEATEDDLSYCPGLGPLKAKRLYAALHQSFMKKNS